MNLLKAAYYALEGYVFPEDESGALGGEVPMFSFKKPYPNAFDFSRKYGIFDGAKKYNEAIEEWRNLR